MRSTLLCAFLVVAMVGLATTAGAYDFLYTGDKAATHDAGAFGVKAGLWYFMADEEYNVDGDAEELGGDWTAMYFPICVYYGVMDQFEIGVKPNFQMLKFEPTEETREDDSIEGTGIGDTWIYAKYMFMPEPMVTARLGAKVATGSTEDDVDEDEIPTGSGQMDIDAALMFGMPAGPGTFDAAVGYRMRMENSDTKWKPGPEIHFAACYGYGMGEALTLNLAADGYFGSDGEFDGEAIDDSGCNIVFVNPGVEYMMESGLTLGADFHYPLMGKLNAKEWGLGLYVGWGR